MYQQGMSITLVDIIGTTILVPFYMNILWETPFNLTTRMLTHLLTHSLTHSLTQSLTHSLTYVPYIELVLAWVCFSVLGPGCWQLLKWPISFRLLIVFFIPLSDPAVK